MVRRDRLADVEELVAREDVLAAEEVLDDRAELVEPEASELELKLRPGRELELELEATPMTLWDVEE